jgi:hypothetical protein
VDLLTDGTGRWLGEQEIGQVGGGVRVVSLAA